MQKPAKNIAKETLFVGIALMCMILIIVFTSIVNAGLDPSKMFTPKNAGNALINAAITVFGVIAALPAGMVSTKQRKNPDGSDGRYLQEFSEYYEIRQKIEPRRLIFSQWHNAQHIKEQKQKCTDYLLSKGILQTSVILNLTIEQVRRLTTSQVFTIGTDHVYVKALTEEQIEACVKVLSGKVIVHKLPDYYFLYFDGKSSKTFYDQAYREASDENLTLVAKLLYRICTGFIITCIFTGLVVYEPDPEASTAKVVIMAIINIVARIFNAVSSTLWGWLLGQELVYKQCYYINGRTQFLKLFDSDVDFKADSIEEIARAEVEAQEGVSNERNNEKPNNVCNSTG
jgi:hypothetical protein